MSNKLADIFSDKEIVHGRISFCTSEDKKRFICFENAFAGRGKLDETGLRAGEKRL